MSDSRVWSEVYSIDEVAAAAARHETLVQDLIESEQIELIGGYLTAADAVRLVRRLGSPAHENGPLFGAATSDARHPGLPAAVSSTLHAGLVVGAVWIGSFGQIEPQAFVALEREPVRLVFLNTPGPGGGGGGGGERATRGPRPARREAPRPEPVSSPVPDPPPVIEPTPAPPEPLEARPLPPIIVPAVPEPADTTDEAGVLDAAPPDATTAGPGDDGGAGDGKGAGLGTGEGRGVGEGEGGGTGGGVYGPGSGVEPPVLIREVKPDYTESARRQGLEGEVLLEIVIGADGNVTTARILRGLGEGLDELALDAVRAWQFSPATRRGTPVAVRVEVIVEFRLR